MPQVQQSQVKKFWETRAQDQSLTDAEATHSDVWQRWLEIETIKPFLRATDSMVDVGCGSGYATRLLAPFVRETLGVDFSESMIDRARTAAAGKPNLRFEVGNALDLDPQALGTFDVALSVRCLINLESWDLQQRAIENIAKLLKPGGRFIFVEGLADGRRNLNAMRAQMGLAEMPTVWHNVDFEESQLTALPRSLLHARCPSSFRRLRLRVAHRPSDGRGAGDSGLRLGDQPDGGAARGTPPGLCGG